MTSTPKFKTQGGLEVNYNRNKKLKQITPETLVVGMTLRKKSTSPEQSMTEGMSLVSDWFLKTT